MRITNTGLLHDDPARSTPGYVLFSPVEAKRAYLIDHEGEVAHEWATGGGMTNWCYLLPNGNLFINERCENPQGVALTVSGRLCEYDWAGNLVWSHEDPWQHHDARRLPDGAVYLAFTGMTDAEKAALRGGVPGSESEGGPYGEAIREVDEAGTVTWEWPLTRLGLDSHAIFPTANRWSYGHTNTVCPVEGGYLISSKNMNLLFIVDRATGAVRWEYQNDALGGQHDAQMLDNGNILVFANGAYAADLHHSEVWEIDPRTDEIVWRYGAKDDPTSFFSPHISSAQRLPSGNTLICEGSKGCIFEVTPDGDIVREYVNPFFVHQTTFGNANWLFRARWYAPDAPELRHL